MLLASDVVKGVVGTLKEGLSVTFKFGKPYINIFGTYIKTEKSQSKYLKFDFFPAQRRLKSSYLPDYLD